MRKHLALFALAALASLTHAGAWAATYVYTGATYSSLVHNFTAPCGASPCQIFTAGMRQTGSITTNQPLAPNLNDADVSPLIASYAFNDGVTQYTSANLSDGLLYALVTTDAAGNITDSHIAITHWQTANHLVGGRMGLVLVNPGGFSNSSFNELCTTVSNAGICTGTAEDTSTSYAVAPAQSGAWAPIAPASVQAVPVDNPVALLLTAAGLLGLALRSRRTLRLAA
ncbi:hypothetical protein [Acidovorax sp. ACV01]|uniref:hypothetical protein n=1 Tax=Acidovorax sp. ACV01 TaxID=2769311 RepID=UPI00178277C0|nr:hypothetical protein [Acidovorax sp. ACV01]MBD9392946.1 hypothetical protein [Acidovorax sp. ACV01]